MNDGGSTCPLCGEECKSRDHVRQHLHTHHRKFELIEVCVGGSGDDAVAFDTEGSADGRRERGAAVSSRTR
jgi:hypothetical protein